MNNRYVVSTVGDFFEVFDTKDKITVFATEDKHKAVEKCYQMNKRSRQGM